MSLSPHQRFVLITHVNALVQPDFEALVFALEAPQSVIPSGAAAQGNRSSALLQWVEGPTGCGMAALLTMLRDRLLIAPPCQTPLLYPRHYMTFLIQP